MTELLADSLDMETTLTTIASLALPHDGGWCIVDLVEDGHVRRVAVVHSDPQLEALARRLEGGWPPQRDDPFGAPRVMQTRTAEVIGPVTPVILKAVATSPDVLETLTSLGIGSMLVVPLIGRSEVLGAVTYVSPTAGYVFGTHDVAFAEEVAHRASQAIENARQYAAARRAERAADEANRAKMAFLATLSHELRTPLNAISGYAQLLMEGVRGTLSSAQEEQVRRIQVNERRLLGLVDAVLSYARVEAGHTEFVLEDVPIAVVLSDVEATVEPIARLKGVPYDTVAAPPPPIVVHADRAKLCQILINLANNAVKFSLPGAPIRVACQISGDDAFVSVTDTGIGIAPENLAMIFQPFVQAHDHGTAGEEGSGLGLAISRRLARDMGGDLVVESSPGLGSTFTMSIPLAHDRQAAAG